jgi:hypothetical protein
MKVNESTLSQTTASQLGKAREAEGIAPGGPKKSSGLEQESGADQVQLSDLSGRLGQVLSADARNRAERVEKLASEYQAGRYHPKARETSRSMVAYAVSHEP